MPEKLRGNSGSGDNEGIGSGAPSLQRDTSTAAITAKFRAHVASYYREGTSDNERGVRGNVNADGYSPDEQEAVDSR